MNSILTTHIANNKSYSSISDSPFTVSFTNSGTIYDNTKIYANKHIIMLGGYIYLQKVYWKTSGSFYLDMPFNTPANLDSSVYMNYAALISRNFNYIYYCCIDVYQSYLRFRVPLEMWSASTSYTVIIHLPGIIMKYA